MCLLRQAYRKLALKLHPDKNGAPGADEVGSRRGDPPLKRCYDDWVCLKMIRIPSGKLTVCYGSHCPFSSLIYLLKVVIFHSYVSLPKDKDTPTKNLCFDVNIDDVLRGFWGEFSQIHVGQC
jgi:hypothetical protein